MNEADRKLLAEELLDECYHEVRGDASPDDSDFCLCIHCYQECTVEWSKCLSGEIPMGTVPAYDILVATSNRSFTTPDDFFAVKRKLVEKGKWDSFDEFAVDRYSFDESPAFYADWLIDEARFCQLACSFLKGETDNV